MVFIDVKNIVFTGIKVITGFGIVFQKLKTVESGYLSSYTAGNPSLKAQSKIKFGFSLICLIFSTYDFFAILLLVNSVVFGRIPIIFSMKGIERELY